MADQPAPDGATGEEQASTDEAAPNPEAERQARVDRRNADLAKELKETRAQLAEFQTTAEAAVEAKAREEGRWNDVLAGKETALSTTAQERDAATQRADALQGELLRRDALDAVRGDLAEGATYEARAVLEQLIRDKAVDLSEGVDQKAVRKAFEKHAPRLLKSGQGGNGALPGAPGLTSAGKPLTEIPAGQPVQAAKGGYGDLHKSVLFNPGGSGG